MSAPIIQVQNLGKCYRIGKERAGRYTTLRDVLANRFAGLMKSSIATSDNAKDDFWALKEVNFTVREGEVMGVVGRNGAGKSTLLKILSRITEPTTGRITLRGRVASLLEVGTGFHPELTGRENIYLNGAILGMTKAEIVRKFDEIVDFAGVSQFLDLPVKRYSSGMYVRLAFAVAANLDPEILIIDEVLAVGDAEFQKKCLGKMSEVARSGRTVLFVSHNLHAVTSLCTSAIVLERGQCIHQGGADDAVSFYLKRGAGSGSFRYERTVASSSTPHIKNLEVLQSGEASPDIEMHRPITISLEIGGLTGHQAACTVVLQNSRGIWVVHTSDEFSPAGSNAATSIKRTCTLPAYSLNADEYTLTAALGNRATSELYERLEDVVRFEVSFTGPMSEKSSAGAWRGATGPGIASWT